MKPSDFMPTTHDEIDVKPPMQADMDALKAMFDAFAHNIELIRTFTQVFPIDNDKITRVGPVTIVEVGPPGFHGVNICINCTKLAVTAFRDAAQALEDIITFTETHPTPKG